MFKYSCSVTHLANWVFSQVNDQPGAVFPCRKGWSFFVRSFYPAGSDDSMLMALTANNSECVVFMPIDDGINDRQITGAVKPATVLTLRKEFRQLSYQVVLITSERHEERVKRLLESKSLASPLLVLYSDRIGFQTGNFENPRLEFRLSQLEYDPDLIPGFFHDSRVSALESAQKPQYYQALFHRLNQHWLLKENRIPLRQLVSRSIPCWGHFRKADQKKVYEHIYLALNTVFGKYFNNLVNIETHRKKEGSHPEEIVVLPGAPESRKTLSDWNRKQKQALSYLGESRKPLTIEELELFIN